MRSHFGNIPDAGDKRNYFKCFFAGPENYLGASLVFPYPISGTSNRTEDREQISDF